MNLHIFHAFFILEWGNFSSLRVDEWYFQSQGEKLLTGVQGHLFSLRKWKYHSLMNTDFLVSNSFGSPITTGYFIFFHWFEHLSVSVKNYQIFMLMSIQLDINALILRMKDSKIRVSSTL